MEGRIFLWYLVPVMCARSGVALTQISADITHKNLAVRRILGVMRTTHAKSGSRSQHVPNYTLGKRSRTWHGEREASIVCEQHFSISVNGWTGVKVLLKCAIRFSILLVRISGFLYANVSSTCVRCVGWPQKLARPLNVIDSPGKASVRAACWLQVEHPAAAQTVWKAGPCRTAAASRWSPWYRTCRGHSGGGNTWGRVMKLSKAVRLGASCNLHCFVGRIVW